MLVDMIMSLAGSLFDALFMMLGVLPEFSPEIIETVDIAFQFMFDGVSLLNVFVDFNMVKLLIPIVIAVINFDKIAKIIMFVIKKIPMIGID